jgi:type II secretion system protein N
MIALSPTQKSVIKWGGYPVLGLVTFVFALHYTFPYGRVKEKLEKALSEKYDVDIEEVSPGWIPGHMTLEGMTLSTRPEREDQKPVTIEIARVDVNIGFFALLGGEYDVEFDAEVGDGEISGRVIGGKEKFAIELHTDGLPLESVPGTDSIAGGAPIKGAMKADVDLTLPKGKWRDAEGTIHLTCEGCVMGDGETKMRPTAARARNAFSEGGFTLPPTRLGNVEGKITVKKGIACIESFEAHGPDGDMIIEGGLKFDDPFARSTSQLYAKIKISDAYQSKHENMKMLIAGIPTKARRSDGYFGYFTREPVSGLWWKPAVDNPAPMRECGADGASVAAAERAADRKNKRPKRGRGRPDTGEGTPNPTTIDRAADRVNPRLDGIDNGAGSATSVDVDRPLPTGSVNERPAGIDASVLPADRPEIERPEDPPPGEVEAPPTEVEDPTQPIGDVVPHDTDPDQPRPEGEEPPPPQDPEQ